MAENMLEDSSSVLTNQFDTDKRLELHDVAYIPTIISMGSY